MPNFAELKEQVEIALPLLAQKLDETRHKNIVVIEDKGKQKDVKGLSNLIKAFAFSIKMRYADINRYEKEFNAKFPEDSPKKDIAGKESTFKVRMISVQKVELPEINDDFAKSLGAFNSLVDFKKSTKEGIIIEKKEQEKR